MQQPLTLLIIAGLAVSLAGCDMVGEEIAERAAEEVTGTDIDVDEEGISVESSEGSFSADSEGGLSMETEDGEFESQAGQVPEGFPDEVPLPDATVLNGSRMDGEDGVAWMVNFQFDSGDPATVLEEQVAALEGAGFSGDGESDFSMGDGSGGMSSVILEGDEYRVHVSAVGETDDFILGYQVFELDEQE